MAGLMEQLPQAQQAEQHHTHTYGATQQQQLQ